MIPVPYPNGCPTPCGRIRTVLTTAGKLPIHQILSPSSDAVLFSQRINGESRRAQDSFVDHFQAIDNSIDEPQGPGPVDIPLTQPPMLL